jgi:DNA-binding MarR family transcriptional regulator
MSQSNTLAASPEAPEGYRLSASFPYIVRRVGLRIGELFDRAVAPYGVDVSMYRVIAALAESDRQQLGQLGEVTTIELSTLSRLVGTMSARGLLTRRRPRGNGRIVEISLSVKGRRLAADLMPVAVRFEAAAVKGLGEGEIARLKAQLEAAYRNLDRLEEELSVAGVDAKPARKKRRGARTEAAT